MLMAIFFIIKINTELVLTCEVMCTTGQSITTAVKDVFT